MANPARDIRERVQALHPGASVIARARNSITHRIGQRVIVDSSLGPLHIAGTETEIDTAWQPTTGAWQYQMIAADYHAFSRNQLGVGTMYRYLHPGSGQYVEFQPLALNWVNDSDSRQQITQPQSVMGVVGDDLIRFPNGYGAGRHFEYRAQTARLVKVLTIDSLANLPTPTVTGTPHLEIEFILSHSAGVTWYVNGQAWDRSTRVITANQIEARDSLGNTLWTFDYPRAWDSAGNETIGQMVMRRQGANRYVTVRIPKAWVDAAVYPIHIDPTITPSVGASADDGAWRSGSWSNSGTTALVGVHSNLTRIYKSFYRFTGVTISGEVDVAYITQVSGGYVGTLSSVRTRYYAEDADNPSQIADETDADSRTYTTAYVDFDPTEWTQGTAYNSPSLVSIIQELVDSYTISNEAVQIFHNDDGTGVVLTYILVAMYDHATYDPALLHVEYTESGGPTYTLAAAAGTYSLTGQAATLTTARKIAAEAGTYSLTGQAAGLLANRSMTAETGSYTLTGQAVNLLANRLLLAEAGAYTLTGIDATLTYSPIGGPTYTLVAETGSYTLTGADAGLLARRVLAAEAGVYAITGADAGLLVGRILAAESGVYTITGQDADLLARRILTAESGAYALTGQAVTLLYSGGTTPTPASRIYVISAEDRVYIIALDDRTFTVEAENRTFAIEG